MIIANQWYNIAKTGSVGSKTSVRIELGTYYALIAVSVDYGNAVISAIESNATDNKITIAARIRYNNGWMVDVKVTPGMADAELQTSLYDNSGWISVPAITSTPGSTVCIINDISSAIQFPQAGGESLFERINVGTEDKPVYAVVPKRYNDTTVGIVSETFITFGGLKGANGNNGNQGAGLTKINVVINDISYTSDGNTVTVTEKLAKQSDLQTLTSKVSELEKKVSEFSSLWTYDKVNDAVRTTFNVIIEKALTFGIGDGDISGEGGSGPGVTSLYALPEIGINKSSLSDGQVMTYDKASGLWVNKLPSIGLDEVKLAQYLTVNSYLDKKSADGLYTTLTAFNALDTKVNDFLAGTDTDEIINKWKELEAFLAGQTETSTLAELLFVKADKTALEATNKALEDYRSKTDARLDSLEKMWFFDPDHADTIRTVYNIAVEKAITFGGYGESDNTAGGITSVTKEMVIEALDYTPYDSANPKGYITNAALSDYATKGTTLSHYGITDAYTKTQVDNKLTNYLTTNTAQTVLVSGAKIFKGSYGENIYIGGSKSGVTIDINAANGGYARALSFINSASDVSGYVLFGAYGNSTSGFQSAYIGVGEQDYNNAILNIYTDRIAVAGAASFSGLTSHEVGLKIGTINVTEKSQNSSKYIEIDGNLVVKGAISFGGYGESSGSGGGITNITYDMVIDALGFIPYNSSNPKGYITSSALSSYATQSWVTENYQPKGDYLTSTTGVTLSTDQTITGIKTFSNGLKIGSTAIAEKTKNSTKYVEIDGNLVVTGAISFGGFGEGSSTGGGITTVTKDMVISALGYTPYNASNPCGYITASALSGYATQSWVNSGFYSAEVSRLANTVLAAPNGYDGSATFRKLVSADIPNLDWSKITSGKPTTLSGYGITDAYTKAAADSAFLRLNTLGIDADGVTNLNQVGYGYTTGGWYGSGPALAFGSTNGYTALIQQGISTQTLYVSYKANGGDIQDWKTIAFTDSNVASATKLKNARTLWGQSFNGTKNISGSLSDVTTITATGNISTDGNLVTSSDVYGNYFLIKNRSSNPYYKLTDGSYSGYVQLLTDGSMALGSTSAYSLTVYSDGNTRVNGNLVATGSITFGSASDRRLKDNIKSMTDKQAVAVLSALNPVTFNWNSTAYELGKLSGVSDGFIADEYEKLIPNSGRDIWANFRAINYERATGYLVKGWQNHETRLEKAERRIKELENELIQYRRA